MSLEEYARERNLTVTPTLGGHRHHQSDILVENWSHGIGLISIHYTFPPIFLRFP